MAYTFSDTKKEGPMKVLSLKLKEDIFEELESIMEKVKLSRNAYINQAIKHYNQIYRKGFIRKQLKQDSILVREESLKVAKEFEGLDNQFLE